MKSPGCTNKKVERNCDYHGKYEANVVQIMDKEIIGHCPVCEKERKEAEEKKAREEAAMWKERRIKTLHGQSLIPKRFLGRTLENYRVDDKGQEYALKVASLYAKRFEDRLKHGGGLVFCGRPGTGKTHLAAGIANEVIALGRSALFMTVIKAVRSVKETYSRTSEKTEAEAIKALIEPDLLILDEVGVQFGSEAEKLIIFEILNGRYEEMRPTIVISNLEKEELGEYLGERVIDRLQEGGGAVVAFTWESYRQAVHGDDGLPVPEVKPVSWKPKGGYSKEDWI